jgi:HEAT repeat protein
VSIRASSSSQIDPLIAQLSATDVAREAAVARLTIIGTRAVDRLIALAQSSSSAAARAAAFRTLDAIGDPRALDAALAVLRGATDPIVAVAATSVARSYLRGSRSAAVVDALTGAALDRARAETVRIAAVRTLLELDRETIAPLLASLAADPNPAIVELASPRDRRTPPPRRPDPIARITRAAEEALPDDPAALREAIAAAADVAPLPLLLRIIERVRDREAVEPPERRMTWATARAAAHLALADRGSRLALYDLRESLDRADAPMPVECLTALARIGDASCLEPIAAAYTRLARAGRPQRDWWRVHLTDAFRAIVTREQLSRRHAVVRRLDRKWKAALSGLWAGA